MTSQKASYRDLYAAQFAAFGSTPQYRLKGSSVLVVGAGGLGTCISTVLIAAGVGQIILLDPQRVEPDNFNRYPFARRTDIGKLKVDVVAGSVEGRPYVTIVPVVGRAEGLQSTIPSLDIDLVVSATNTIPSRLAVAEFCCRNRIPHLSAGLSDARATRSGLVTIWIPERRSLACPACFLQVPHRIKRSESVEATTVATVGSFAAALAVELLSNHKRSRVIEKSNYWFLNIGRRSIEALLVFRRATCDSCSGSHRTNQSEIITNR